jgi:hypothetical protein
MKTVSLYITHGREILYTHMYHTKLVWLHTEVLNYQNCIAMPED